MYLQLIINMLYLCIALLSNFYLLPTSYHFASEPISPALIICHLAELAYIRPVILVSSNTDITHHHCCSPAICHTLFFFFFGGALNSSSTADIVIFDSPAIKFYPGES
jgi:hypothetical protein